jgi:hypothetical protein
MVMFDLAQGYHHMLMDPKASCLLGFQVGLHWYCYLVLPFGLKDCVVDGGVLEAAQSHCDELH